MTNLEIERIGTLLVLEYEKSQGRRPLKEKFKGCGWDICTGNSLETRYIEIKTSRSKKLSGRWIEKKGWEQLKNNPDFWIYSVTEISSIPFGIIKTFKGSEIKIREEIKYILCF